MLLNVLQCTGHSTTTNNYPVQSNANNVEVEKTWFRMINFLEWSYLSYYCIIILFPFFKLFLTWLFYKCFLHILSPGHIYDDTSCLKQGKLATFCSLAIQCLISVPLMNPWTINITCYIKLYKDSQAQILPPAIVITSPVIA